MLVLIKLGLRCIFINDIRIKHTQFLFHLRLNSYIILYTLQLTSHVMHGICVCASGGGGGGVLNCPALMYVRQFLLLYDFEESPTLKLLFKTQDVFLRIL